MGTALPAWFDLSLPMSKEMMDDGAGDTLQICRSLSAPSEHKCRQAYAATEKLLVFSSPSAATPIVTPKTESGHQIVLSEF